jgi:hypothetical protein
VVANSSKGRHLMLSLMLKAQCGLNLSKESQSIQVSHADAVDRPLSSKKCDERERRAGERQFTSPVCVFRIEQEMAWCEQKGGVGLD